MALDRQSIEKKDFPVGRRGYDQEAVDAHLRWVADKVEELSRSTGDHGESLAAVATEQVRAILESAETTATKIRQQAEEDSRELRERAAALRERLRGMESELRSLIGADRVVEPPAPAEAEPEPEPVTEPEPEPAGERSDGASDLEAARLVALNMALNGSSREETDRHLAENFNLSDRSALLDEVYASVEG
jgi:DivIVA domain-containing protein